VQFCRIEDDTIPFHNYRQVMSSLAFQHTRAEQLSRELRGALDRGVASWLVRAVQGCIIDLNALRGANAPTAHDLAVCAQAETLLELCRGSRTIEPTRAPTDAGRSR
jgi:hypothetical protein